MSRRRRLLLCLLLVTVQLAVPASMIGKRQGALNHGEPYKFRIGPVDPYDPFLGRYLELNLEAASYDKWHGEPLHRGQIVYAVLERDRDGFARLRNISMDPPGTRDYIRARVQWQSENQVRLRLPLTRYYLEEQAAQHAWRIQRDRRRQPLPAYILVKVRSGFGVIEEMYIQNQPLLDYMRSHGLWPPTSTVNPEIPAPARPAAPVPDHNAPSVAAGEATD